MRAAIGITETIPINNQEELVIHCHRKSVLSVHSKARKWLFTQAHSQPINHLLPLSSLAIRLTFDS